MPTRPFSPPRAPAAQIMRTALLTALALLAFAGNSLLCRLALAGAHTDPASFTAIRLVAGAMVLALLVRRRGKRLLGGGSWLAATALFVYAAGFSFAYVGLSTATGALLLFGAVQISMTGAGLWHGDRLARWQVAGLLGALVGLLLLLLPGLSSPAPLNAALMIAAGVAWSVYSLRGRGAGDPTAATAGNFLRAAPMGLLLLALAPPSRFDRTGVACALLSGALTSGLGYVIWYKALRGLRPVTAATVQLSVPVLATIGGMVFLAEPFTTRILLSSAAILGGMALVILARPSPPS
ncbi:drug/metabolite transporter (DMT)-like permease [Actimicrobium sp. GrIS 1.19]|uniref:DMT family transporter n=1 Tax=Actimicrobium sp. GrIS 1.19 TaxID=3071708 RepID=UPI002E084839|nr:drug/metabolite transporter (DMT)-like permease [Actimicrobium sp. GrIS 1.19]